ncbi:MAG: hypothetical protein LBR35_00135 [Rickettsiales bacterium]|jgi:hypothetical protein|nr:hypothetical protein [Rickettsiales bacterium]
MQVDKSHILLKQINFEKLNYFQQRDFIKSYINKVIYSGNKLTFFLKLDPEVLKQFAELGYLNQNNDSAGYIDSVHNQIIIEKEVYFNKGLKTTKYNAGKHGLMTISDNQQSIIRALVYAYKFRKLYEEYASVEYIVNLEKMGRRTVYKYLNLAYMSPKIVNEIMEGKKNYNLQDLFVLASKYDNFQDQECNFI